jgi:hypothetical protein
MNKKLTKIYNFLKTNRKYNKIVQAGDYSLSILPYTDTFKKVYALLYNIHNTQSQLKMDTAAQFYKTITGNRSNLTSFKNLLQVLGATEKTILNYKSLFELLKAHDSWGDKTAALFVKAVYNIHAGYSKQLMFWQDAPVALAANDELYLPVDAVIYFIFEQLGKPCSHTFSGINNYIKAHVPKSEFEVWDDLWFWGFITQKGGGKTRTMEFNEAKYWNLLHTPKDEKTLIEIKVLAREFIQLLKQKN